MNDLSRRILNTTYVRNGELHIDEKLDSLYVTKRDRFFTLTELEFLHVFRDKLVSRLTIEHCFDSPEERLFSMICEAFRLGRRIGAMSFSDRNDLYNSVIDSQKEEQKWMKS